MGSVGGVSIGVGMDGRLMGGINTPIGQINGMNQQGIDGWMDQQRTKRERNTRKCGWED